MRRDNPSGLAIFSLLGWAGWTLSELTKWLDKAQPPYAVPEDELNTLKEEKREVVRDNPIDNVVGVNPPQPELMDTGGKFDSYRFEDPDRFEKIRIPNWAENVAQSVVSGSKVRMGKLDDGTWAPQSVLIPKDKANESDAVQIVDKISNNPPGDYPLRVPVDIEVEVGKRENPQGVGKGVPSDDYLSTGWSEVRSVENTSESQQQRLKEDYAELYGEEDVDLVNDKIFVRDNPSYGMSKERELLDEIFDIDESLLQRIVPKANYECEDAEKFISDVDNRNVKIGSFEMKNLISHLENYKEHISEVKFSISCGESSYDRESYKEEPAEVEVFIEYDLETLVEKDPQEVSWEELDEVSEREQRRIEGIVDDFKETTNSDIEYTHQTLGFKFFDSYHLLWLRARWNQRENPPYGSMKRIREVLEEVSNKYDSRDEAYKTDIWRKLMKNIKSLPSSDVKKQLVQLVNDGEFASALNLLRQKE